MAAFSTIAAVATVAAAAAGAAASIQQGRAARKQAKFTAAVQRRQAERERQVAAGAEEDFRRRQSRLMAERRAALGGAGIEGGAGSPLLGSEDFAAETELQALRIRSGGETQATRLEQQAQLTTAAGRQAQRQGFARAGASLLSGVSAAFGRLPSRT